MKKHFHHVGSFQLDEINLWTQHSAGFFHFPPRACLTDIRWGKGDANEDGMLHRDRRRCSSALCLRPIFIFFTIICWCILSNDLFIAIILSHPWASFLFSHFLSLSLLPFLLPDWRWPFRLARFGHKVDLIYCRLSLCVLHHVTSAFEVSFALFANTSFLL